MENKILKILKKGKIIFFLVHKFSRLTKQVKFAILFIGRKNMESIKIKIGRQKEKLALFMQENYDGISRSSKVHFANCSSLKKIKWIN